MSRLNDHDRAKSNEQLLAELDVLRSIIAEFERVETKRQRAEDVREAMSQIAVAAHHAKSPEELYHSIHTSLSNVIDARNFYIALYYPETGLFSFPYAVDEVDKYDDQPHDLSRGLTAYVLRTKLPILVDEAGMRALEAQDEIELIGMPSESWVGVPLMVADIAIGVMVVQSYTPLTKYTDDDLQIMTFVSEQVAMAIERKRNEDSLARAFGRMKHDLQMAAKVQRSLLPREAPRAEGYEFSWIFSACDEVAGDMLNLFRLDDDHVGLYVLDVSGHGMQAALLSVTLSTFLSPYQQGEGLLRRAIAEPPYYEIVPPSEVARTLNRRFPISLETNQFFTLAYGVLNVKSGLFRYVLAGQQAPLVVGQRRAAFHPGDAGPSIGIVPDAVYPENELVLGPGEIILLHTDGVEEASDLRGEQFGLDAVAAFAAAKHWSSAEELISALHARIISYTRGAGQADDITMVAFGRQ